MRYNVNIKTIALALSLLFLISPAFALDKTEAMKLLTVNTLLRYGQKLYERGDYQEAGAVFKRVLTYNSAQPLALQCLKDMGYAVDMADPSSLRKAIELKKQKIERLRLEIQQLRANLATSTHLN